MLTVQVSCRTLPYSVSSYETYPLPNFNIFRLIGFKHVCCVPDCSAFEVRNCARLDGAGFNYDVEEVSRGIESDLCLALNHLPFLSFLDAI